MRDLRKLFDPPASSLQDLQLEERRHDGFHKPLCVNVLAHLLVINRST